MVQLTINQDFKDRRIAHGNTAKTMGERNQKELLQIAIQARKSDNPILLECFANLPELAVLLNEKTDTQIAEVKAKAVSTEAK